MNENESLVDLALLKTYWLATKPVIYPNLQVFWRRTQCIRLTSATRTHPHCSSSMFFQIRNNETNTQYLGYKTHTHTHTNSIPSNTEYETWRIYSLTVFLCVIRSQGCVLPCTDNANEWMKEKKKSVSECVSFFPGEGVGFHWLLNTHRLTPTHTHTYTL